MRPEARALSLDAAALAAAKLALGLALFAGGFVALSDDDFSRVVIAERFAADPRLDASGTSWLPLPFWVAGAAMAAFGRTLGVAHGVALVQGTLGALLVHRAAVLAGLPRRAALGGAALAAFLPTAARLGVAFQPEALVAGLVTLGAATASVGGPWRLLGGLALGAACLCRYEAWAAAAAFSALSALDARRGEPVTHVAAALAATAPSLAWMAHGVLHHGDALFFLHRVAAYRRALGASESMVRSALAYPIALLRSEPELVAAAAVTLRLAAAPLGGVRRALGRPALVVGATVALLVAGRLIDGAPTHHDERPLLPAMSLLALAVAAVVDAHLSGASGSGPREQRESGATRRGGRAPSKLRRTSSIAVMVAALGLRALTPAPHLEPRPGERAIGDVARNLLPPDARLAVDTPDYGYFAVIAAFGAPERAVALAEHDPRVPATPDPLALPGALRHALAVHDATYVVVSSPHRDVAAPLGPVIAEHRGFALVGPLTP